MIVSASLDNTVKIWDILSESVLRTIIGHRIMAVSMS